MRIRGPRARPRRRAAQRGRRRRRLRGSGAQQEHVWLSQSTPLSRTARRHLGRRSLRSRGRSAAILIEQPSCEARRQAPGIADLSSMPWQQRRGLRRIGFDVNGNRHKVPADTKRALLTLWPASVIGRGSPREPRIARSKRELRPLPVATTLRQAGAMTIRLGGHLAGFARRIA